MTGELLKMKMADPASCVKQAVDGRNLEVRGVVKNTDRHDVRFFFIKKNISEYFYENNSRK